MLEQFPLDNSPPRHFPPKPNPKPNPNFNRNPNTNPTNHNPIFLTPLSY